MFQAASETASTNGSNGWMQGASAPLRGALLGLLLERPGAGGELVNLLKVRLSETWRIERKDVYRLLDRLEEEGLAVSREEPRRGKERRTRLVYHPTEQTPAAIECWMKTLTPRQAVRQDLQAKFAVARPEHLPSLSIAVREYERQCSALAQLVSPGDGEPSSCAALCLDITRDAVYATLRAEIDWAARARRRIDEYAARSS
jgi:DNA-binding PadR family transcriptional regulator